MYLDHIGDPCHAERQRAKGNAALDSYVSAAFTAAFIGTAMQETSLCSELIFDPLPLDVDQRTPPRAVEHVLQGADRRQIVLRNCLAFARCHPGTQSLSTTSTPSGRSRSSTWTA